MDIKISDIFRMVTKTRGNCVCCKVTQTDISTVV